MPESARVIVVHAVAFLAEEFRKLMRAELRAADCLQVLNESLLQDPGAGPVDDRAVGLGDASSC